MILKKLAANVNCGPDLQMALRACSRYSFAMRAKDILLEVAEALPPNATLADAISELEFRQAVEDGLASLDKGNRIPLEEARGRISEWTAKYSSPPKR